MPLSKSALVICGPTASGKTNLALQIATSLGSATIINVDSRQAYREIPIISGQDTPRSTSSHINLIGHNLFSPSDSPNVSTFTNYVWDNINHSKKPIIIVGGSGLYLKSVTSLLPGVFVPPDLELRKSSAHLPLDFLQAKLKLLAPNRFNSLNNSDQNNPRRLIRAIEIANHLITTLPQPPKINFHIIGILPDNLSDLRQKIKARVIARLNMGAINELSSLLIHYPNRNLPIYTTLGINHLIQFLDGKINTETLIESWTRTELNYAKRQMTWFKKQPSIIWYHQGDVFNQTKHFLQYFS